MGKIEEAADRLVAAHPEWRYTNKWNVVRDLCFAMARPLDASGREYVSNFTSPPKPPVMGMVEPWLLQHLGRQRFDELLLQAIQEVEAERQE